MTIEIRRTVYKSPPEARARIGSEVLVERQQGVPWKVLERKHGYCRGRLAMLAEEARVVNMQQDCGINTTE